MRNRAKCKLCQEVIESFHRHDYVCCKCGEIAVDGGNDYHRCMAKDWDNFLRMDDNDNIIIPKVIDKSESEKKEVVITSVTLTKHDKISMLREMIKSYERLPDEAKLGPINHYDFISLLLLLSSLLTEVE